MTDKDREEFQEIGLIISRILKNKYGFKDVEFDSETKTVSVKNKSGFCCSVLIGTDVDDIGVTINTIVKLVCEVWSDL